MQLLLTKPKRDHQLLSLFQFNSFPQDAPQIRLGSELYRRIRNPGMSKKQVTLIARLFNLLDQTDLRQTISGQTISGQTIAHRTRRILVGLGMVMMVWAIVWHVGILPVLAEDYNKEILVGADFSGKTLIDSSFTKANLRESNFSGASLQGVSFFGANLEGANLQGADLRNTTLDTARLSHADLTNAILEGAFAFNTKFDGAAIAGADFTDVEVRRDVQDALCKAATGRNPVTGRATRATLNCA